MSLIRVYAIFSISILMTLLIIAVPFWVMDYAVYIKNGVFHRSGGLIICISILGLLIEIKCYNLPKTFFQKALESQGITSTEEIRRRALTQTESIKVTIYAALAIIGTLMASYGDMLYRFL